MNSKTKIEEILEKGYLIIEGATYQIGKERNKTLECEKCLFAKNSKIICSAYAYGLECSIKTFHLGSVCTIINRELILLPNNKRTKLLMSVIKPYQFKINKEEKDDTIES